jgi:hypothetical protein
MHNSGPPSQTDLGGQHGEEGDEGQDEVCGEEDCKEGSCPQDRCEEAEVTSSLRRDRL